MSLFSGFDFFIVLILFLMPAIWMGIKGYNLRKYRIILTVFFIYMVFRSNKLGLLYLILYSISSLFVVKIYLRNRLNKGKSKGPYSLAIIIVLVPLFVSKTSSFMGTNIFGFLGLSYIFFKVVQVIIETYDGIIKEMKSIEFLEFLLFFPSLSSGPIDRSRRFIDDSRKVYSSFEYDELLSKGVSKIMLGVLYKFPLSGLFSYLIASQSSSAYDILSVIKFSYMYGFYMFFDFAGYSLMAVGTGYILGIRLPDNFNKPFISEDIQEFWNRWHISLSHWFRDFVFSRLVMNIMRKKILKKRLYISSIALIINMLIMGLWHGLERHYIIYGLYHGLLLALWGIYKKKSNFYKKHKSSKIYKIASTFLTFNLVMFGFLIFSGRFGEFAAGFLRHYKVI